MAGEDGEAAGAHKCLGGFSVLGARIRAKSGNAETRREDVELLSYVASNCVTLATSTNVFPGFQILAVSAALENVHPIRTKILRKVRILVRAAPRPS